MLIHLPFSVHAKITQEELEAILQPRIDGLMFLTKSARILDAIREQNRINMPLEEIRKS